MIGMTDRQSAIYNYVLEHIERRQRPPTIRSIMDRFGLKSPNSVVCHFKALERKGLIVRNNTEACAIEVRNRVVMLLDVDELIAMLMGLRCVGLNNLELENRLRSAIEVLEKRGVVDG